MIARHFYFIPQWTHTAAVELCGEITFRASLRCNARERWHGCGPHRIVCVSGVWGVWPSCPIIGCYFPLWRIWMEILVTRVDIHIPSGCSSWLSVPHLYYQGERRAACQALNSYLSSLRTLFFPPEWETHDLLLAVIALLKEVATSDRSIYYANYTFKSTVNAKPEVESAVITGAGTVSHRSVCDKRF